MSRGVDIGAGYDIDSGIAELSGPRPFIRESVGVLLESFNTYEKQFKEYVISLNAEEITMSSSPIYKHGQMIVQFFSNIPGKTKQVKSDLEGIFKLNQGEIANA